MGTAMGDCFRFGYRPSQTRLKHTGEVSWARKSDNAEKTFALKRDKSHNILTDVIVTGLEESSEFKPTEENKTVTKIVFNSAGHDDKTNRPESRASQTSSDMNEEKSSERQLKIKELLTIIPDPSHKGSSINKPSENQGDSLNNDTECVMIHDPVFSRKKEPVVVNKNNLLCYKGISQGEGHVNEIVEAEEGIDKLRSIIREDKTIESSTDVKQNTVQIPIRIEGGISPSHKPMTEKEEDEWSVESDSENEARHINISMERSRTLCRSETEENFDAIYRHEVEAGGPSKGALRSKLAKKDVKRPDKEGDCENVLEMGPVFGKPFTEKKGVGNVKQEKLKRKMKAGIYVPTALVHVQGEHAFQEEGEEEKDANPGLEEMGPFFSKPFSPADVELWRETISRANTPCVPSQSF